jgi:hypothetical protein
VTAVRKWVASQWHKLALGGAVTAVAVMVVAGAVQSSGAAVSADCGQPSYDGATFSITCTIPQATTTVTEAGPTVTVSPSSAAPTSSVTPSPTPSATPTPTPTVVPAGFPNASNTGVPAGTVLAKRGSLTVTQPNTVIDSMEIDGCLTIAKTASNVTVKNSLIRSKDCVWNIDDTAGAPGLKVIDTEIDGLGGTTGDAGIHGYGYTLTRVNIHGTGDGLKVGTGDVIQDSYIHDLAITSSSHNDGIQCLGTTSLTISHNTIVVKDGATSAIILSTGSADAMRNVTISNNLLAGGAYTVYGGYQQGTDVLSRVSNIQILTNQFSTQIFAKSGAFGPLTSTSSPVVVSGNTWADGPNKGKAVS